MFLIETAPKRARAARGPAVLAAVVAGTSLADIAAAEHLNVKMVEGLLRAELRKRWVASTQDYARLQIARLEAIALELKDRCGEGRLPAIDRLLKVLDRLDRYHSLLALSGMPTSSPDEMRERLTLKITQATRAPGHAE